MTATANGRDISAATIIMARVGAWSAEVIVDDETALTGRVTLEIDGQTFLGSVVRSGVFAGRVSARIVGGAGGLKKKLPAKSYSNGPSCQQVLGDILRESSETLAGSSSSAVLATRFARWHREEDTARHAIEAVAEKTEADWRVLADGTIWFGTDSYPEQKLEHDVVDEDWARGVITIDPAKPELRPGVTFLGLPVEEVRHYLTTHGLRTEASAESLAGHYRRLMGEAYRRIDYSRMYPGKVTRQNADGSIQVVLDDALVKSPGLDHVPIRGGLPGSVKVSGGTRCHIGFEAGDPSRPYAEGWETADCVSVAIANGSKPACGIGNTCTVILPATAAFAGTIDGLTAAGVLTFTPPVVAIGVMQDGNDKVLV